MSNPMLASVGKELRLRLFELADCSCVSITLPDSSKARITAVYERLKDCETTRANVQATPVLFLEILGLTKLDALS
jgi:hypothetical protein